MCNRWQIPWGAREWRVKLNYIYFAWAQLRPHLIGHILRDHALLLLDALQVIRILPTKLGGQRDNHRRCPYAENHHEDAIAGPRVYVVDIGHRPVAKNKRGNIKILCLLYLLFSFS